MEFAQLAPVRFGFGPAPGKAGPGDREQVLAALRGPDDLARRWPGITTAEALSEAARFRDLRKTAKHLTGAAFTQAEAALTAQKKRTDALWLASLQVALARAVEDATGFRERLWAFWRDHFTVQAKRRQDLPLSAAHAEALRPHITGTFATLLRVAETHPMMLIYLDQSASIGPNSNRARRHPEEHIGLNENLAREVLELHTLGVHGAYSQADVRQLAELFTGMRAGPGQEFSFAPHLAEPGAETVLGQTYGGDPARVEHIYAALDALAVHPDTARHLASKLAVHFVGPDPAPELVTALAQAYAEARGALMPVYQVLLTHPAALGARFEKIRQPFDYIATALRALGLDGAAVMALDEKLMRRIVQWPMRSMAQPWLSARGPDGWPEAAEDWISPQQLAARINWAMQTPRLLRLRIDDPAAFAAAALGPRLSKALGAAVVRAETRAEAVGLVLASAEFQRR